MKKRYHFYLIFLLFVLGNGCATKPKPLIKNKISVGVNKDIQPDSATEAYIKPYRIQLEATMNRVIGYTKKELVKSDGENTLGNFVADAILRKANEISPKKVDLAAVNNGGLRVAIPKGAITVGNMYELMPFENELVILELTGKETYKFFEFQAFKRTHIANSKVKVAKGKPKEILIGGIALDTNRTYLLALSDYMATSEPAYLKEIKKRNDTGVKLRDMLIEYFEKYYSKGDTADAQIEGRLVFE